MNEIDLGSKTYDYITALIKYYELPHRVGTYENIKRALLEVENVARKMSNELNKTNFEIIKVGKFKK